MQVNGALIQTNYYGQIEVYDRGRYLGVLWPRVNGTGFIVQPVQKFEYITAKTYAQSEKKGAALTLDEGVQFLRELYREPDDRFGKDV